MDSDGDPSTINVRNKEDAAVDDWLSSSHDQRRVSGPEGATWNPSSRQRHTRPGFPGAGRSRPPSSGYNGFSSISTSATSSSSMLDRATGRPSPMQRHVGPEFAGARRSRPPSSVYNGFSSMSTSAASNSSMLGRSPLALGVGSKASSLASTSAKLSEDSLIEPILDEVMTTGITLPDEFLANTEKLIIHSPVGDDKWHRSADGSFEFVVIVRHGVLYVRERYTKRYWPLAELVSSSANRHSLIQEVEALFESLHLDAEEQVTKLPDKFLQNVYKLVLQAPVGDGWHRSTDGTLQYMVSVSKGELIIQHRRSGEYRALNEILSSAIWFQPSNTRRGLGASFVIRSPPFFSVGRVFRTLFTEPCTDSRTRRVSTSTSTVTFGESVRSEIATFVVVQLGKGFCYACRITDYEGRGTLKPGCNPSEHAPVYLPKKQPSLLPGETGMSKMAIEIVPTGADSQGLTAHSRIRFGRGEVVQYTVKAEEIGHVSRTHIDHLKRYWKEEICGNNCNGEELMAGEDPSRHLVVPSTTTGFDIQSQPITQVTTGFFKRGIALTNSQ